MISILLAFISILIIFFFVKEKNSLRSRAIFLILLIISLIIFFTSILNPEILLKFIGLINISEFQFIIFFIFLFQFCYTIYIYIEVKNLKNKITFIIRSLALNQKNGKFNKKKIKK